jgi:hypothetical protein
MRRLPLALVLLGLVLLDASRASAGTVYGGYIRAVNSFRTKVPSCGVVAYEFTIESDYYAKVYDCSGTYIRTNGPLKAYGTGWCSGAFFVCGSDPTFYPETNTLSATGLDWLFTINIVNADPNPAGLGCAGYHSSVAGPLYVALPVCCQRPTSCPDSCMKECDGTCRCTPVALEFGNGWHFTSIADGVRFRVNPGEVDHPMAWTDPAFGNGFLVLPNQQREVLSLNGEMFTYPRLAEYLLTHSSRELRIWFDRNQDGVAQPDELRTLDSLGIGPPDLKKLQPTQWRDANGNQIDVVAPVEKSKSCISGDVWLKTEP